MNLRDILWLFGGYRSSYCTVGALRFWSSSEVLVRIFITRPQWGRAGDLLMSRAHFEGAHGQRVDSERFTSGRPNDAYIRYTPQEQTKVYRQDPILKRSVYSMSGESPWLRGRV
ncbi:hypothetical protein BDP27DRAFT_1369731 [Rhodocollybia butyracea]|uniref:Uncharacterized protein n=1 Tax=Rhodocollybia butyracea TaxID=206335 RepID=A0A9P5PDD5_9AGAR|nr:hypothetical protein BDP27DRAFT_1369731 [Rhodocollybia butyracea]